MEAQERDDKGPQEGNRNGEDGLNLRDILGVGRGGAVWLAGWADLGREGMHPSSGGCGARPRSLAAGTDNSGRAAAGSSFSSAGFTEGLPQGQVAGRW